MECRGRLPWRPIDGATTVSTAFAHRFTVSFCLIDCLFIFFICLLQEDLLIHGDSVYDIVDKQDHGSVQSEMGRAVGVGGGGVGGADDSRLFLCRMNVSRNARRQMRFGDQKVSFSIHLFKNTRASRRIPVQWDPLAWCGDSCATVTPSIATLTIVSQT